MRRILSLVVLAGAVAVLGGCGGQSADSTSAPGPEAGGSGNPAAPGSSSGGGTLQIGLMPKKKGIPYFTACQKGAEEAAKELGDVQLTYDGPVEDRSEEQSAMVDTWALRKFSAVAVACNDPEQISTSLARARDAGCAVITYDADANPTASKRQFFINQAVVKDIAETLVDEMVKQAGADAKVGVVSSSPTAPNQSAWLKEMETYRKAKYPKLEIVVTEYAGEVQTTSFEKATNILKAYPDIKGIWGMTSVAFPGAAQAVEKAGKSGKVAVVGLSTPKDMKEFVDRGVVKSVVLWNPVDLGYLTVHVARAVSKGDLKEGATAFKAGRLGEVKVNGSEILLGKPMIFDKSNIGQFDF